MSAFKDLPSVVCDARGSQYWMRLNESSEYHFPVARSVLPAVANSPEVGWKIDGRDAARVIAEQATVARTVARDFAASGIRWDEDARTIVQGYELPAFEPRFDGAVDAWLRALTGDRFELVCEWLAACAQAHITSPAAALVLLGPHSLGKTLLAIAAARMWGAEEPVALSDAIDKFNASITRCPTVLDDECKCLKSRDVSTADIRNLTQARRRTYEPKGVDKRELHGAQRFVFTGQGPEDLRLTDLGAADIVDAVALRLLVVNCGLGAREALNALRLGGTDDVDMARIDSHVAWIAANTTVRPQRFLASAGEADPAARAAILDSALQRHAELFDVLREAIERGPVDALPKGKFATAPPAFIHGGRLWVRLREAGGVTLSPDRVSLILAPWSIGHGAKSVTRVKVAGETIRAKPYDLAGLSALLQDRGDAGDALQHQPKPSALPRSRHVDTAMSEAVTSVTSVTSVTTKPGSAERGVELVRQYTAENGHGPDTHWLAYGSREVQAALKAGRLRWGGFANTKLEVAEPGARTLRPKAVKNQALGAELRAKFAQRKTSAK